MARISQIPKDIPVIREIRVMLDRVAACPR
jgi:hypothetical protein